MATSAAPLSLAHAAVPVLAAEWAAAPGVHAVTTLRHGAGGSLPPFEQFNMGNRYAADGDDPAQVERNRALLRDGLGLPSAPHWLRQVHGTGVLRFEGPPGAIGVDAEPTADAAVTSVPGVVLAILTADCLPVVLAARDGGEIGAATTLLLESASPGRRGFHVSWQVISQGGSALLGAALGALLTRSLSEAELHAWGWRIPFLVGLLIIPVGLYIRRQVDETWRGAGAVEGGPVRAFLREHPRRFGLGLLIVMSATLLTYLMQFYMPTYMTRIVGLPATSAYLAGVASSAVQMAAALAAGLLLDRFGRYKPVALVSLAVALLGIYPAFVWLNDPTTQGLAFAARFVVITAMSVNMTAGLLLILAGLPRPVRATGLAMTYALAVTLFGGTAQFIATWLIEATGSPLAPAWYLIVMLLIGWLALLSYPERHLD